MKVVLYCSALALLVAGCIICSAHAASHGDTERRLPLSKSGGAPVDCDNGTSYCPAGATCCKAQYSPSHWGCEMNGACCTLGPAKAPSTTLPNCIVLGDSVSIGYTPDVISMLSKTCAVQHTPWDVSDGGAGSTDFALNCLDVFLATAHEQAVHWDVIFFNFGLHNLNNDSAAEALYSTQLMNITQRLQVAGKKVVFGLTTPFMPDYLLGNHVVEDLNLRAQKIMTSQPTPIPVVGLYDVIVKKCGPLPYVNCSICRKEPCSYHYNAEGSELLATAVSTAIKSALLDESESASSNRHARVHAPAGRGSASKSSDRRSRTVRQAPGFSCDGGTTYCPADSKCCNTSIPVHLGCMLNGACCRPGPKNPPSNVLPNILIMGDSVSDGYTPLVQEATGKTWAVQHTPWPWGGSADSTGYAMACLDHFLKTDKLMSVNWDLILFNFGLHDLDNDTAAEKLYGVQLSNITSRLIKGSMKVVYALTTPFMPDYNAGNHVVEQLNAIATTVMQHQVVPVPIVDLYTVIADRCGPLPYVNCSICARTPCSYHYTQDGYKLLATAVEGAITKALHG